MKLETWDHEIRTIGIELKSLKDDTASIQPNIALFSQRAQVLQAQYVLARTIERLQKLAAKQNPVINRLRTLLHWGGIYADRMQRYYDSQTGIIGKAMWLQLIRTRIAGNASEKMMVDETDLLDMAMRQAGLQKTEQFLQRKLVEIHARKNALHERYRDFNIEQANHEAACCMQEKFGKSPSEIALNPVLRRIAETFMQMTWSIRLSPEDHQTLDQLEADINGQTSGLLGRCRSLVIDSMGSADTYVGSKTKERFRQSLEHIHLLQEELFSRSSRLAKKMPLAAKPKVMKKTSNRGKTLARNHVAQ